VSHETIYRSLFVQARGVLKKELLCHLRSKRAAMNVSIASNTVVQSFFAGNGCHACHKIESDYRNVHQRKMEDFVGRHGDLN
jgi:cytochrome c2